MKTLKEIEFSGSMFFMSNKGIRKILRQEAINWLKEIEKAEEDCKDALTSDGSEPLEADEHAYDDTTEWITHFFNLTEEDLNDKSNTKKRKT